MFAQEKGQSFPTGQVFPAFALVLLNVSLASSQVELRKLGRLTSSPRVSLRGRWVSTSSPIRFRHDQQQL